MNFRNAIAEDIPSVEAIYTDLLKLNPFFEQGKPSNRTAAYSLFFYAEKLTPDASEMKILENSIFTDDFIVRHAAIDLSLDTQYENPLLYYIIHRSEPFPTGSKYSQFLSNLFQKNYTGKTQPPQIRMLLQAIDFEKLCTRISDRLQNQANSCSQSLETYLNKVMIAEPRFSHIYSEYGFNTPP